MDACARVHTHTHSPQWLDHVPTGVFYIKHCCSGSITWKQVFTPCTQMSPSVSLHLVCSRSCPFMSLAYTLPGGIGFWAVSLGPWP